MADTADSRRRWDTDDRFSGVADAGVFADSVQELAQLARRPGWVAEEPEVHLVPHLRSASVPGLTVLTFRAGEDGVLHVAAEHTPGDHRRDIRRRAWALLGHIAETLASVHEHAAEDAVMFDVITGGPGAGGAARFATHGHTIRLTLRPAPPAG
jgi:hypothetical protein